MPSYEPGWSLRVGVNEFIQRLGIEEAVEKGLFEAAEHLKTEWRRVLKQPGSGRTYAADVTFRTINGRVVPMKREAVGEQNRTSAHTASVPGEPPATDSGVLSNSIDQVKTADGQRVGSPVKVARWLHYGVTDHPGGITIKPRPHADVALEQARDGMRRLMKKHLRDLAAVHIARQLQRELGGG